MKALQSGLKRLSGLPLSLRPFGEIHDKLLDGVKASDRFKQE